MKESIEFFNDKKGLALYLIFAQAIGIAMYFTRGHYNPYWIIALLTVGFLCLKYKETIQNEICYSTLIKCFIAWNLTLLLANDNLIYVTEESYRTPISLLIYTILIAYLIGISVFNKHPKAGTYILACSIFSLILGKYLVLLAAPSPFIDVFTINSAAVNHLINGANPYSQFYNDIYEGAYGYTPGFTYWPGYLIFIYAINHFFTDIRTTSVLSEAIFAISIFFIAKRSSNEILAPFLLVLFFLSYPTGFFIIEQSWTDPVTLGFIGLTYLFLFKNYWILGGFFAAFAFSSKQYAFISIIFPLSLLLLNNRRAFIKTFIAFTLTISILFIPFLILDFNSFYANTVQILFEIPNRTDSFSLIALIQNQFSITFPSLVLLLVYIAIAVIACFAFYKAPKSLSSSASFTFFVFFALFMLGKQAFCNYYYLVFGLATLVIACHSNAIHIYNEKEI